MSKQNSMYSFPIEKFIEMNKILRDYYTGYFMHDGLIYGESTRSYECHVVKPNFLGCYFDDFVIPPNHIADVLKGYRKTRTFVPDLISSTPDGSEQTGYLRNVFRVFFSEKDAIKDISNLPKGEWVINIKRTHLNEESPVSAEMRNWKGKITSLIYKLNYDPLSFPAQWTDVPLDYLNDMIAKESPITLSGQKNEKVIITREEIPAYKKLVKFSTHMTGYPLFDNSPPAATEPIVNFNVNIAILRSTFKDFEIFTFLRYTDITSKQ